MVQDLLREVRRDIFQGSNLRVDLEDLLGPVATPMSIKPMLQPFQRGITQIPPVLR
jgi:hypothetical protein